MGSMFEDNPPQEINTCCLSQEQQVSSCRLLDLVYQNFFFHNHDDHPQTMNSLNDDTDDYYYRLGNYDIAFSILSFLSIEDIMKDFALVNQHCYHLAYSPVIYQDRELVVRKEWLTDYYKEDTHADIDENEQSSRSKREKLNHLFRDVSRIQVDTVLDDDGGNQVDGGERSLLIDFMKSHLSKLRHVHLVLGSLDNEELRELIESDTVVRNLSSFGLTVVDDSQQKNYSFFQRVMNKVDANKLKHVQVQMLNIGESARSFIDDTLTRLDVFKHIETLYFKHLVSCHLTIDDLYEICDACPQLVSIGFSLHDLKAFDFVDRLKHLRFADLHIVYNTKITNDQLLAPLGRIQKLHIELGGSEETHKLFSNSSVVLNGLQYLSMNYDEQRCSLKLNSQMKSLRSLTVESSEIESNDFRLLGNLDSSLRYLVLMINKLNSVPIQLAFLGNLTHLTIYQTELTEVPSGILKHLINLKVLDLALNSISSLPFDELESLPTLTQVYLSHNVLANLDTDLLLWPSLRTIRASWNRISSMPVNCIPFILRGGMIDLWLNPVLDDLIKQYQDSAIDTLDIGAIQSAISNYFVTSVGSVHSSARIECVYHDENHPDYLLILFYLRNREWNSKNLTHAPVSLQLSVMDMRSKSLVHCTKCKMATSDTASLGWFNFER